MIALLFEWAAIAAIGWIIFVAIPFILPIIGIILAIGVVIFIAKSIF
jgi:hypothetical protein